jgi:glycosyltransferase involved in cell wall biosynthesis
MITYNHRPYIEQAVRGVLNQKVDFGVELVIGEDFSSDGTREKVFEFARQEPSRIRVITSESNVGMHANSRRTARACRGKYMAFCEGDDYWNDPLKLSKQVALLESDPGYVMVHSHCNRYYVETRKLVRDSLVVPKGLNEAAAYEDVLLGARSPLTVTVVASREKVHWVRENCPECTDPKWPMGDTQLWLELSRLGKVGCIHEPLATTNVLLESAGQSQDRRKRLKFYLKGRELKLHYLKKYPVSPELERKVREKLAWVLLHHAFEAQDAEVAREMWTDYQAHCAKANRRAKWLVWGSASPLRQRIVRPMIRLAQRGQNLKARIGKNHSSAVALSS